MSRLRRRAGPPRRRIQPYQNMPMSYNVRVRALDPAGRTVQEHVGRNIYLDSGRNWLSLLLGYKAAVVPGGAPPATYEDGRVAFIALGVGGREQASLPTTPVPYAGDPIPFWPAWYADWIVDHPLGVPTWAQDDTDTAITGLELETKYDALGALGKFAKPFTGAPTFPASAPYTWITFTALFSVADITDAYGQDVPISEAAIYPAQIAGGIVQEPDDTYVLGNALAYEAFPTITKTVAAPGVQIECSWSFRY